MQIRRGVSINDTDSPVLGAFLEDEFGRPIPKGVQKSLCGDAAAFWEDMIRAGEMPTTFYKTGLARREEFRALLEHKYPWLRLCEGHWKVYQLWVNYFPGWKSNRFPRDDPPVASNNRDDGSLTTIDTPGREDTTGPKREREDVMDTIPSKRHKGKQPEQPVSRPLQQRLNATVTEVCPIPLALVEYLLKAV